MFSVPYLCLCIYCILQLGFWAIIENRRRNVQNDQEKYFFWMLVITIFSFLADILSSIYTGPDWLFAFAVAGTYCEIILNVMLLPIFVEYACEQMINLDSAIKRRLNITIFILAFISISLLISTAFTGEIFYFDKDHMYHRGPLFMLPMLILFLMMAIIETFIISQRKNIEVRYFKSLTFFIVPPLIGWALQSLLFGLPFSLLGITFAAQIVFTNIQNRSMDKDYLTGAYNRQALDRYMQYRIDTYTGRNGFSAILLDIDNFKMINDSFGHYEGDMALINAVHVLHNSVRREDFIARYGGDEFCIILEGDNPAMIEETINQIDRLLSEFNRTSGKPYYLHFSIGYAVYDQMIGDKLEQFFQVIDKKMYDNKNAAKLK